MEREREREIGMNIFFFFLIISFICFFLPYDISFLEKDSPVDFFFRFILVSKGRVILRVTFLFFFFFTSPNDTFRLKISRDKSVVIDRAILSNGKLFFFFFLFYFDTFK